jgi:hypothetical protein
VSCLGEIDLLKEGLGLRSCPTCHHFLGQDKRLLEQFDSKDIRLHWIDEGGEDLMDPIGEDLTNDEVNGVGECNGLVIY